MKTLPLLLLVACADDGNPIAEPAVAEPTACSGHWFHTTDEIPDSEGLEVLDAVGRVVEHESNAIGSVGGSHFWWVWETDPSGSDRLLEESFDSDGDDEADHVVTYGYRLDDRLRLAWTATWAEGSPDREDTYTYDAADQLVERTSTADAAPAGGARYTWEQGRLTKTENVGPEGGVYSTLTRDYLEPAPSLDRVDTWFQGAEVAAVARSDFDDAGQLLAQWAVDDRGETLVLTQAWDDESRLIDAVTVWPTGGIWGDEVGETHTTWIYSDDGRVRTERSEEDTRADGTVEQVGVTEWSWSCE